MEQLNLPLGTTADNKTRNIYIADRYNNCVKVYDKTSSYLFKFRDNEGEGKMYKPINMAICRDRILISQRTDS